MTINQDSGNPESENSSNWNPVNILQKSYFWYSFAKLKVKSQIKTDFFDFN